MHITKFSIFQFSISIDWSDFEISKHTTGLKNTDQTSPIVPMSTAANKIFFFCSRVVLRLVKTFHSLLLKSQLIDLFVSPPPRRLKALYITIKTYTTADICITDRVYYHAEYQVVPVQSERKLQAMTILLYPLFYKDPDTQLIGKKKLKKRRVILLQRKTEECRPENSNSTTVIPTDM